MTAAEVKAALRHRHPALWPQNITVPGEWTCLEEFRGIDLLAIRSWGEGERIGYEVKVSRSDLRKELLSPSKRWDAVACCHRFFFAVPKGLLTDHELAWRQPVEWTPEDFMPSSCTNPDCHASAMRGSTRGKRFKGTDGEGACVRLYPVQHRPLAIRACCTVCKGRRGGRAGPSRAEREAPTLWIPPDVGLIVVEPWGDSYRCREQRKAPFTATPKPLARNDRELGALIRWASFRNDPRHRESVRLQEAA